MPKEHLAVEERRVNEKSSGKLIFQLVDEDGIPIGSSDISTLTITLYDVSSDTKINSRDAQNCLNANNVTFQTDLTISGVTAANPAVVTCTAAHNLRAGDKVYISGVVGMTELNGRTFEITPVATDSTKFTLNHEDSSGYTAWSSGGSVKTGLVTWSIQQDDMIIDATTATAVGSYESHKVLFKFTTSSAGGNWEQPLDVLSLDEVS